jgi:hypothetical protein
MQWVTLYIIYSHWGNCIFYMSARMNSLSLSLCDGVLTDSLFTSRNAHLRFQLTGQWDGSQAIQPFQKDWIILYNIRYWPKQEVITSVLMSQTILWNRFRIPLVGIIWNTSTLQGSVYQIKETKDITPLSQPNSPNKQRKPTTLYHHLLALCVWFCVSYVSFIAPTHSNNIANMSTQK